jgi:precorrin-2 C20-methyltransferase/precorrin-3B C17-methyltransferase
VLKLGRTFGSVRDALVEAGKLDDAWYVERATWPEQRIEPFAEVDPDSVPYFSLAVLPSPAYAARVTGASAVEPGAEPGVGEPVAGEVVIVGLGPAGPQWLTPEAEVELGQAEHLVGYGPYLTRVPQRAGQRRHASGNRVEAERAVQALELAAGGARVAVVSSGDPGVFAMATAVLEQVEHGPWAAVAVRVVPGVTAAQAAAARVGAPLGHDYCVLSLSDRLKPWPVIERRLEAAGAADLVLALYNPASRTRTTQLALTEEILLRHRTPETPVVIARDVGGAEESVQVVTLAALSTSSVDMRCLLIIGSSRTRVATRADGSPVVWTPRRY